MSGKTFLPTKILWMDLEMTGLDNQKDVILEVAAEVTDFNFKTLDSYEARITHDKALVVERMKKNTWWQEYPANRDNFLEKLDEGKKLSVVDNELSEFVKKNFDGGPALLAGNSIHNDRLFIKSWLPNLELLLHYRMLDVTSWKVIMQAKYGVEFEKKDAHRAYDDTQASIAELQEYLDWFSQNKQ